MVQDGAGSTLAVHRTYLTQNGRKASLDPPKATLGPLAGAPSGCMPQRPKSSSAKA
jgi:hypothetical protein